jgi:hypothetical protein
MRTRKSQTPLCEQNSARITDTQLPPMPRSFGSELPSGMPRGAATSISGRFDPHGLYANHCPKSVAGGMPAGKFMLLLRNNGVIFM